MDRISDFCQSARHVNFAGLMDGTIMVEAARARRGVSAFFSNTRSLGKYERRDRAERRVKCAIQIIQQ